MTATIVQACPADTALADTALVNPIRTGTALPEDAAATPLPELDFVAPMPGFGECRRFVLVRMDEDGLVFTLRSLEQEELSFLVVSAAAFFPDYHPELDEAQCDLLGLHSASSAMVLLVVTPGERPADATANLLAPVVIDISTRRAGQLVLHRSDLPLRAPLAA